MKKLLPFAFAIGLFIVPPTAFASKFAFNSPIPVNSTDGLTAGPDILSASICSRDIARGRTNELLEDLLNSSTDRPGGEPNNSNDSTTADYFDGINGLGPDGGDLNKIDLFETNFNKADNAATTGLIFEPESIYNNEETHLAFVAVPSVPEPMSVLLLGSGLAGLYVRRRRRKNSA